MDVRSPFFCAWIVVLSSSCAGSLDEPSGPDRHASYDVLVSVEHDPRLDPRLVIKGCRVWESVGVTCGIALQDEADVHVRVANAECTPVGDGFVLAEANTLDRSITIYAPCTLDRGQNEPFIRTIFAHEIGHHLGMPEHVPLSCDDPHLTTPDGVPICGRAVMNPKIDPSFDGVITVHDLHAFESRIRELSLALTDADADAGTDHAPDCTLVGTLP